MNKQATNTGIKNSKIWLVKHLPESQKQRHSNQPMWTVWWWFKIFWRLYTPKNLTNGYQKWPNIWKEFDYHFFPRAHRQIGWLLHHSWNILIKSKFGNISPELYVHWGSGNRAEMRWLSVGVVWGQNRRIESYATSFVDMAGFKFTCFQKEIHIDMMIIWANHYNS